MQTEARCILLENLRDTLNIIEVKKYLQPFSVWALQQFPESQVRMYNITIK